MTVKRYVVQQVEGVQGIEKASDNPMHRRLYGPGDIIELDDKVSDVAGIMANGQIVEYVEPETPKGKTKTDDS